MPKIDPLYLEDCYKNPKTREEAESYFDFLTVFDKPNGVKIITGFKEDPSKFIWNGYPLWVYCYFQWREEATYIKDYGHWTFKLDWHEKTVFPELAKEIYSVVLWIDDYGHLQYTKTKGSEENS